jgi:hypothetical protein
MISSENLTLQEQSGRVDDPRGMMRELLTTEALVLLDGRPAPRKRFISSEPLRRSPIITTTIAHIAAWNSRHPMVGERSSAGPVRNRCP